jgi:signal transduction histidine kinase
MAAGIVRSKRGQSLSAQMIMLRRLKIALFGAVIIPALLLVAAAWDERAQLLHAAEGNAVATVTALREHAVKAIESHELLIRELDSRIQGRSWEEIRASSAALSEQIKSMHVGMPEVSAMTVTDADGRRWAGSGSPVRDGTVLLTHREYWYAQRDADRGTFISRAYIGSLSGRRDFAISRRRTSPDGSFNGTIHVGVAASYFSDFWSDVTAGRTDVVVSLVRLDGEVLARLPDTGRTMPPAMAEASPFMRHVQADPHGGVFRTDSTADGIERIYAYSRVGNYPLVVGYGIPVPSVTAPWRQHLLDLGVAGVLVTTALVLAVLAAMRQVHRLIAEQALRIAAEQAAQKGQRLELLGLLTAGIAHDFANILQAMGVVATLLKRGAVQPERVRSLADRLAEDVERGTSLTNRMLDLVRKNSGRGENRQDAASDVINPAEAMSRVCEMLPRLLGSGYQLRCEWPEEWPACLQGDRSELELVVMNLAVNARDAMPDGGEIVIRADLERVAGIPDEGRGDDRKSTLAPGPYVRISVEDSGVGMSPEVLAQAGVLFFTTKPQGQGTGLGLAGARGYAERAGGELGIESEQGRGTKVTLWLPARTPCQASEPRQVEMSGH